MGTWTDKVIVITGGTDGIGRALVEECLLQGARVATCGRNADKLYQLQTQFPGAALFTQVADVSVENDCRLFIERTLETFGKIDVLINNAGFGTNKAFTMSTLEIEQQLLDVLVRTPMRLMHVALPLMKARNKGIIINVSSVAGYIAGGSYSASKSYLTVLSESLNTELSSTNVKVSALCPGFTRTEFHQRGKMSMKGLPNFLWLNSDRLVEQSWRDALKGKAVSVPGWQYKLLLFIVETVPRSIVRKVGMNMRAKQRK